MNYNKCKRWVKSALCENKTLMKFVDLINTRYKKEICTITEYKYQLLIVAAVGNILITLVSYNVLMSCLVIVMCLHSLITTKINKILAKGLISYFPESWKNAMLNRSILDILCDVWFIPNFSLYVKAIVMPLFDKSITPDDAQRVLDHLDPQKRKVFMTKGLAFLMPRNLRKVLLPADYANLPKAIKNNEEVMDSTKSVSSEEVNEDEESLMDLMEELNMVRIPKRPIRKYTGNIQSPAQSEAGSTKSSPRRTPFPSIKKEKKQPLTSDKICEEESIQNESLNPETFRKAEVMESDIFTSDIPVKKDANEPQPSSDSTEQKSYLENLINIDRKKITDFLTVGRIDEVQDTLTSEIKPQPKKIPEPEVVNQTKANQNTLTNFEKAPLKKKQTKVILDSQMMDDLKEGPGRVDPTWDNMELYLKKQQSEIQTQSVSQPQRSTDDKLKLLKFLMELRGGEWANRVNAKYVGSAGVIGLVIVIYRLMVSRKARRWTKNMLMFGLYIFGISVVSGSALLLLLKFKNSGGMEKLERLPQKFSSFKRNVISRRKQSSSGNN